MTASVLAEPKPRWPTMWCSWTGRNSAKSHVAAHGDAATERGVSCDTDRIPDSSKLVTPATVIVSQNITEIDVTVQTRCARYRECRPRCPNYQHLDAFQRRTIPLTKSMACTLSSTSSAACSPTEEFVKDASEASTDCRRPSTFANDGESTSETSVTKPT